MGRGSSCSALAEGVAVTALLQHAQAWHQMCGQDGGWKDDCGSCSREMFGFVPKAMLLPVRSRQDNEHHAGSSACRSKCSCGMASKQDELADTAVRIGMSAAGITLRQGPCLGMLKDDAEQAPPCV